MIQVFEKQLGLMRELAEREDATIHEPLDELRKKRSHSFSCKDISDGPESGSHGGRFERCHEFSKAFLLFIMEREKREAREAAVVAAPVHGEFHAGNAALGDHEFRSAGEQGLQLASFLVVALAN
jgi:hypothetical protein